MTDASTKVTRSTRATNIGISAVSGLLFVLASLPFWGSTDTLRLLIDIFLYVALASLWNFLAGYAGLVSVGQQAYVGLGGYALFALTTKLGISPLPGLLLVGVIAAVLSMPIAGLLFRLRGPYFAIGSWVVAEVMRLAFSVITPLGGASGMSLPVAVAQSLGRAQHARFVAVYCIALILLAVILLLIVVVLRSRYGLALTAIRDNELAARSNGVNVTRTKLMVYVVTAFGTAMTGGLLFLVRLRISPDAAFSVNDWTALIIFMVIIGGLGSFEGPIIGALVYFLLRETLANLGSVYLMILGAVAIGVMFWAPRGIWGAIRHRWGLQILPLQLRVVPPPAPLSPSRPEADSNR